MAESKRARALSLGVIKTACDVDADDEHPIFTLLVVNGAGEGLVARGPFDSYRCAVAACRRGGVPVPSSCEKLFGLGAVASKLSRPGTGLGDVELEARRAGLERVFDGMYSRFSDLNRRQQALVADALPCTLLRERDAADLYELVTSKFSRGPLIEQQQDDDGGVEETKTTPPPSTSSSTSRPRKLVDHDDVRVTVDLDDHVNEPTFSLRIAVPSERLSLVSARRTFDHFANVAETAQTLPTAPPHAPAFPERLGASQRLGFKLTPTQLESRRHRLQTYVAFLIAHAPSLAVDDFEAVAAALDLDVERWTVDLDQRKVKPRTGARLRDVSEAVDLDVHLAAQLELAADRALMLEDALLSSSSLDHQKTNGDQNGARKLPFQPLTGSSSSSVTRVVGDPIDDPETDDAPWAETDETRRLEAAALRLVLPKAVQLAAKLKRADVCLLVQVEAVLKLADADVRRYASARPRWYVAASLLEGEELVAASDDRFAATPIFCGGQSSDDPNWAAYPMVFVVPDAHDAVWARRRLVFRLYDANCGRFPPAVGKQAAANDLDSATSTSTGHEATTATAQPPHRRVQQQSSFSSRNGATATRRRDLDEAVAAHGFLGGLKEFEFGGPGDDDEPTLTTVHVNLLDRDNRFTGAQLKIHVCLTASELALDYAAVNVAAAVKYDKYVGRKFASPYGGLCALCMPTFLLSNSPGGTQLERQRSGQIGSGQPRSVQIGSYASFDGDETNWETVGYFKVSDFATPLAEAPTKFDLVRDPDIANLAPLPDDGSEALLADWHVRNDLVLSGGYQYAPAPTAKHWTPLHTAHTSVRRSVWYRLSKKRPDDDDDDDDDDAAGGAPLFGRFQAFHLGGGGGGGSRQGAADPKQKPPSTPATSSSFLEV